MQTCILQSFVDVLLCGRVVHFASAEFVGLAFAMYLAEKVRKQPLQKGNYSKLVRKQKICKNFSRGYLHGLVLMV